MYVEAFHHLLKYLYLKGTTNKRVDKCIHVLMKLARDKGFERLVKLEKGKTSGRITTIRKRHDTSLKLSINAVKEIDNTTWMVQSSDGAQYHTITWDQHKCPINCCLICIDCNICVHCYTCNCPDALIQSTICKHIHLVVRYQHTHSPSPCTTGCYSSSCK